MKCLVNKSKKFYRTSFFTLKEFPYPDEMVEKKQNKQLCSNIWKKMLSFLSNAAVQSVKDEVKAMSATSS